MFKATINNNKVVEITGPLGNKFIDEQEFLWDVVKIDDNYFHIIKDNKSYRAEIVKADYENKNFIVKINGSKYEVSLKDKSDLLLEKLGYNSNVIVEVKDIKAPMPGLILDIKIEEGKTVKKGDALMILEAMKMENVLKSPGDVIVKSI
nr:biotin/lipoyl-binding protein [Bacteroidota bacterium]